MSNFRSESHVAQQSRRDKLRIQQSSVQAEHLEHFPINLEQLAGSPGLNPDLVHVRNVRSTNLLIDPTMFSSEMLNYSPYSSVLSAQRDAIVRQGLCAPHYASIASPSSKPQDDPQSCNDWTVNYGSGSAAAGGEGNSNSMFVGQVFSNHVKLDDSFSSAQYLKPGYVAYQVSQSSLTNPSSEISSQDRQKQYAEMYGLEMASLMQQNIRESGQGLAADAGNELVLLPAHGNQSNVLRFDNCQQWSGELGYMARKNEEELRTVVSDSNTQGLSLSLSSNSHPRMHVAEFGGRYAPVELPVRADVFKDPQDSMPKPAFISRGCGKSPQEMVGTSNSVHRPAGPLGPFTGYATILKSSKFLKPTQQLLDEFCCVKGSKVFQPCEASERISGEASVSHQSGNADKNEAGIKGGGNSAVSSSAFYSSNEISGEGGVGSISPESYRPEYRQKKAKLLYMQEEVCRRYKQYHQQMQMVVSSFESVAGLSAATPYISVALKTVSRHFRCLKNAILDQLKHVKTALGEDLSSPTTGTSSSKGDTNVSRLKYVDQNFLKHKPGGGNVGFLEPQQHIWRPQRGLPERSVAILRAWLFEHFLHPYPTDTDKHMLATQTGLSRNQVSNWFINARVRVWKPMVEEIHMLETKGGAETNQNTSKSDEKFATEASTSQPLSDQPSNKQMECLAMASSAGTRDGLSDQQWYQEKRSRLECQIPANMDGSLMGFLPYPRNGLEMGGLGAVSLTLGLRHSTESAQQQQQEDQLRRKFGGQIIHDFVG